MSIIDRMIKRYSQSSVQAFFASPKFDEILADAVEEAVRESPVVRFIKAMQMEMLRVDPSIPPMEAWEVARSALTEYLRGEKIKFGDDRFDWSEDSAAAVIRDMEIDHWETAP